MNDDEGCPDYIVECEAGYMIDVFEECPHCGARPSEECVAVIPIEVREMASDE